MALAGQAARCPGQETEEEAGRKQAQTDSDTVGAKPRRPGPGPATRGVMEEEAGPDRRRARRRPKQWMALKPTLEMDRPGG